MKTVTPQAGSATSATTSSKAPLVRRASAVAITLAATAVVLLLSAGAASAQIQNPIDGVKPDLSVFGPAFNNVWVRVIGGIWAVALGASVVKLIMAIYKMRSMKAAGMPAEMADAGQDFKVASIAFGCLASVGIITGAILFLVGG